MSNRPFIMAVAIGFYLFGLLVGTFAAWLQMR